MSYDLPFLRYALESTGSQEVSLKRELNGE